MESIRKGTRADTAGFLKLLFALARFEGLDPPTASGRKRIVSDIFDRRIVHLFVALVGKKVVGYALYFYSYSSFLARPTLYLEDLFVAEERRRAGVGLALFKRCVEEAIAKGCGRMEWSVLNWNSRAIEFYEKIGAKRLDEWSVYRLDGRGMERIRAGGISVARLRSGGRTTNPSRERRHS